eukprot:TRINITY_DN50632_c0_g1_i1.p1 TRINITY_DN50632_c0_g1~~TRINITY_DN50632_c0_g1_i1.p1  ORF type:complete len:162 (+),score=23.46 TRINITY_DN50632_c0_g1_i1:31-516(+)
METDGWADVEAVFPVRFEDVNVTDVGAVLGRVAAVVMRKVEVAGGDSTRVTFRCSEEGFKYLKGNSSTLGLHPGTSIVHASRNICAEPTFSVVSLVTIILILFTAIIGVFCVLAFCRRTVVIHDLNSSPISNTPIEAFATEHSHNVETSLPGTVLDEKTGV